MPLSESHGGDHEGEAVRRPESTKAPEQGLRRGRLGTVLQRDRRLFSSPLRSCGCDRSILPGLAVPGQWLQSYLAHASRLSHFVHPWL